MCIWSVSIHISSYINIYMYCYIYVYSVIYVFIYAHAYFDVYIFRYRSFDSVKRPTEGSVPHPLIRMATWGFPVINIHGQSWILYIYTIWLFNIAMENGHL